MALTANAIILKGQKGHSAVAPRTDSIKQYFWDNNVDLNLVFCDFANWKDEEAYNKLEVFKKTNQPIDCVFANSSPIIIMITQGILEGEILNYSFAFSGKKCLIRGGRI